VVVSAAVGLPPLALVSATAGASTIRCSAFASACFVGRFVRFATIAGGVAVLMA
jgi:membrane protein YqaA with SNARE-associated domain